MAFSRPSGTLDTVHAGVPWSSCDGSFLWKCFSLWCCALPVFDVLHLKGKTDGKEMLAISWKIGPRVTLVFQKSWAMPAIWENTKISCAYSCCQISNTSGLLESENSKSVKFTRVLCCHSVVIHRITGLTWSECYLLSQFVNLLSILQRLSNTISTWNPVNFKRLWSRNV